MIKLGCYDLAPIMVHQELIYARPVEWNGRDVDGYGHNDHGEELRAIMYAATCPYCANLLSIRSNDLVFDQKHFRMQFRSIAHIREHNKDCPLLKKVNDLFQVEENPDIYVILDEEEIKEDLEYVNQAKESDLFVDPLLNEMSDLEIHYELQKILDDQK